MNDATMRAVRVHEYGGPEVLKLDEIPRPVPQAGEVLLKIHAAGVLPIECFMRSGAMKNYFPRPLPYIPGAAVAGVITALGEGVTNFEVGQAVCGRSTGGAYCEYVGMAAETPRFEPNEVGFQVASRLSLLIPKPASLSFDEATTLSGGATTAWTALFEDGNLQAGQRVLIHGGAGGVGAYAVQFARWKGAHVTATASTANLDFVRSLGAEKAIDYATTPFEEEARDMDFVLDTRGGETLRRSMYTLKRGGTIVSVVETPPAELGQELGVNIIKNTALPTNAHLLAIGQLIDAGYVKPTVQQVFSLAEAPQAHALCETGHGRGRIVLHIAD